MTSALLFGLLLAVSIAGFGLLALSQRQHRIVLIKLFPGLSAPPRLQRWLGILLLVLSAFISIVRDGIAFGLTVWILTITLSAFVVVLALSWIAGRSRQLDGTSLESDE